MARVNKLYEKPRVTAIASDDLLTIGQLQLDGTYKVKTITRENELEDVYLIAQEQQSYPTGLYEWLETIADGTATADMDGAALVNLGGRAYLMGGWYPVYDPVNITNNEVWLFNEDYTGTTQLANAGWEKRHSMGYASNGSKCWIVGGDLMSGHYQNDAWMGVQNEDLTITWTEMNADCGWRDRVLFGFCEHNGSLYVIGGQSDITTNAIPKQDVWKSDDDGVTWTQIVDGLTFLGKSYNGCATSYNGYIYLIGGGVYKTDLADRTFLNTVYRSADGITWEQLENAPFEGRQYPSVTVHENKIFVLFGNDGEIDFNRRDCWTMDVFGNWEQLPLGATARHATASVSIKNKLIIATGNYHNDTWVLEHNTQDFLNTKYPAVIAGEMTFTSQINANGGIVFPNSTSYLNFYKEGDWTPRSSTITLVNPLGKYTRIGNVVYLFFSFTFPTTSNGSFAEIQGLPFTGNNSFISGANIGFTTDTSNYTICQYGAVLQIYKRTAILSTNAENSGKLFSGVCIYQVV